MVLKKYSTTLINIIIIIIAIFILLLFLEIFSRNFIRKVPDRLFVYDPKALIWDKEIKTHVFKKPSKSLQTNGHFREHVFIDNNGFRVNSFEENIINPQIVTIGDSQTFGHGLSNNDTWPNLLAKSINLSVGNRAVWGYGMQHYDLLIEDLVKKFKPKYLIYGMTDNDICSLQSKMTTEIRYKEFMNFGKQSHIQALKHGPKDYIIRYTSLGKMLHATYLNIFYKTSFGIWLRPMLRPETSINITEKCTKPAIDWLIKMSLFLKQHNIKTIVIQIPHPRRVASFASGFPEKKYEKAIELIKLHQNNSFYFIIDPIKKLSEHYKKNNYERTSIILPVDGHNNRFSNKILSDLILRHINTLE